MHLLGRCRPEIDGQNSKAQNLCFLDMDLLFNKNYFFNTVVSWDIFLVSVGKTAKHTFSKVLNYELNAKHCALATRQICDKQEIFGAWCI